MPRPRGRDQGKRSGRGGTRTPDICLVRATVPVALEQHRTESPGHSVAATPANTCVQERTREIRGNKLLRPLDGRSYALEARGTNTTWLHSNLPCSPAWVLQSCSVSGLTAQRSCQ